MLLGVDTGGTFTDFVLYDGAELQLHKVLSTPEAPESAILKGLSDMGLKPADLSLVHGSTVATNAVLEAKGARTVYITNRGFGDILTLGRQARPELYNLLPPRQPVPVASEYCLETGGRLDAGGLELEPLTAKDLQKLVRQIENLQPEAVAINLLFSFVCDRTERDIEAVIPSAVFVSRSSQVLPEVREYERGIATWLNAYVGPKMKGYLQRLQQQLECTSVTVMQSSGSTLSADKAAVSGVNLLLSGPAGGLLGARQIGLASACEKLLTFDMGGTSTDVALIDGEINLTSEGRIGNFPVAVPMVDMHTIGAGGGSIAYVDQGGLLQVGPQSAGAEPGPACYGRGGTQATVTDANLLLGRLRERDFLGGAINLHRTAAERAMKAVADAMGLTVEQAAEGIIRVANEHMVGALRVISVQRGLDPKNFTLMSFGGAGGLHVCALAESMHMRHALIPMHAGVLSALGMLTAPRGRQLSHALPGRLNRFDPSVLEQHLQRLERSGREALVEEGITAENIHADYRLDLRYEGQSYYLTIPWRGIAESLQDFHKQHASRYGHQLDVPVELVNLRVGLGAPAPDIRLPKLATRILASSQTVTLSDGSALEIWQRQELAAEQIIHGPALITEALSTTYLAQAWQCRVDMIGNLHLKYVADRGRD